MGFIISQIWPDVIVGLVFFIYTVIPFIFYSLDSWSESNDVINFPIINMPTIFNKIEYKIIYYNNSNVHQLLLMKPRQLTDDEKY